MGFAFTVVKVFLIDVLLLFLCIIRPWLVFQSRAAEGNGGGTPLLRMIQMVRADFVLQHVRHGACQCPPFREGLHPEHQRQWSGSSLTMLRWVSPWHSAWRCQVLGHPG